MAREVELQELVFAGEGELSDVEDSPASCSSSGDVSIVPLLRGSRRKNGVKSRVVFAASWSWAARFRKIADDLWSASARCILLDLTFSFVWSRFLSFVLLLMMTVLLGEESFHSNFSALPSSSSCRLAHQVGICTAEGQHHQENAQTEILVNPTESVSLRLESPSVWALRIVVVVAFANSRYLEKLSRPFSHMLSGIAFILCSIHVCLSIGDLRQCGNTIDAKWGIFAQRWMPPATPFGNWTGPHAEAKHVAEYCVVGHEISVRESLKADHQGLEERDWLWPIIMSKSVKDMWTAWMDVAMFSLSFQNRTEVLSYCRGLLHIPDLHGCLVWLNNSALGNSIQCGSNALASPSIERFYILKKEAETLNTLNGFGNSAQLDRIRQLAEKLELEGLAERGCKALIAGSTFGLRLPRLGEGNSRTDAITTHLLSLAARGLDCPESWAPVGAIGPKHVSEALGDADGEGCNYNTDFLRLEDQNSGPALVPRNRSADYLHRAFFKCIVMAMQDCAGRAKSAYLTTFRSTCQVAFSILMFSGLSWTLWLRWTHQTTSAAWRKRQRVIARLAAKAQRIFASRIVVGLVAAAILQLGCTIILHSHMSTWVDHGHGKKLAISVNLKPEGLIDFLVMASIWSQFALLIGSICCNLIMHLGLRSQLMALEREVFFGEKVAPASYNGPDLNDLKRMGSTSIVYAMYFPGIVFWHLFFASWLLVFMAAVLVGCFVVVFQPRENRSGYAPRLWHWLVTASFLGSILLAHFITRLFTQRCLIKHHKRGMRIRCICLFSWYEIMVFLLSFALGPTAALWDFLKGFFCTVLASLIIQKPNFTQFGELADYVYCTYCASLFLERIAEDKRKEEASVHHMDEIGLDCHDGILWYDAEPILQDHSYVSKIRCFWRTTAFGCLFLGFPFLIACLIGATSRALGYPCPNLVPFMPPSLRFCEDHH